MTVVIGMSGTKLRTPVPTFTSAVPTTITFSWPAVDNATYYEYYTSASGSATSPTALGTGILTKDITVASGNTTLTFYVRAVGPVIYEKSEYGQIQGLSTKGTLPTPASLSGASTTTTRVTFTWAAGTPAPFDTNWTYSYYTIINGVTSATTDGYATTSVAIDVPNIGDTAAIYVSAKGTNYITSATANTSKAAYGYWAIPTVTTAASSPSSYRASWTAASGATYEYYTSADSTVRATTSTSYQDITGLSAGGSSTIYVRATGLPYATPAWSTGVVGYSYLGVASATVSAGVPASTTSVTFSWTGTNASSFTYHTSYNATEVLNATSPVTVSTGAANTAVTIYVSSIGATNYQNSQTPNTAVGTSYTGVATVATISGSPTSTSAVSFTWSDSNSHAGSYTYYTIINSVQSGNVTGITPVSGTVTVPITGLSSPGTAVALYVKAIGANNYQDSAFTSPATATSYGYWTTPNLSYTSTSTTTFTVSWSAASGATYQYSTPSIGRTNTSSSSSQSITVSTAGGNTTVTIYATGGVYAESSASITGYGYVGNASITAPTVSSRTPTSVSFSWSGSNITKYYYSSDNANWTDNGTSTSASFSVSAGNSVTIYVKGDAAASYAPASNVSASGTAKSGYASISNFSGSGASYTTVTFSWTGSRAGSYNYYTSADSTVRNTTSSSVTVSNGGTNGASVTCYVLPITNDSNYDTPSSYYNTSASGTTPDTTPNAFSFTATTGATRGSTYTSGVVTLAGMDSGQTTTVSVTGGTLYYSTDNSTFSSTTSSANISTNNIYIKASGTANSSYSGTTTVAVNYGGTTANYVITSEAEPVINSPLTASPATVTVPWPGSSSINMTATTTITNNASYGVTTAIQNISATNLSGGGVAHSQSANVYIAAGGSATFTFSAALDYQNTSAYWEWALIASGHNGNYNTFRLNEGAQIDTTPNTFSFNAITGAELNTPSNSNTVTVTGMSPSTGVSLLVTTSGVIRAMVSTDNSTFTEYPSGTTYTVTTNSSGQLYVYARVQSSSSYSTEVTGTIAIGGVSASVSCTTKASTPSVTAPSGVTVAFSNQAATTATVTVSASGGSAVVSYTIKNYTDVYYTTLASPQFTFTQSGATFSVTGLTQNSSYYVKGFATNTAGTGESSGNTLSTTAATPPPAATFPITFSGSIASGGGDWQSWTATVSGARIFQVTGFDTTLTIFADGTQVGYNDDYTGVPGAGSRIDLNCSAGSVYDMWIKGYNASSYGTYTLTIN